MFLQLLLAADGREAVVLVRVHWTFEVHQRRLQLPDADWTPVYGFFLELTARVRHDSTMRLVVVGGLDLGPGPVPALEAMVIYQPGDAATGVSRLQVVESPGDVILAGSKGS